MMLQEEHIDMRMKAIQLIRGAMPSHAPNTGICQADLRIADLR